MRKDEVKIEYKLTFQTMFHFGTGLRAGLIAPGIWPYLELDPRAHGTAPSPTTTTRSLS